MQKKGVIGILISITFLACSPLFGQYRQDWGFNLGGSNYLGDIGGSANPGQSSLADFRFDYTRWAAGGFFRSKINPKFAYKIAANYVRITGDDSKTEYVPRRIRNLNFKNDIMELSLTGEYYLVRINDVGKTGRYIAAFDLYAFAGIGAFYHNPMGELDGKWHELRPHQTENVAYSPIGLALPTGLGFYYTIRKKVRVGFELNFRFTFSDYLDDVSDRYGTPDSELGKSLALKVNQELLDNVALETGAEVPSMNYYTEGTLRGNKTNDDSYMSAVVTLSWVIRGKNRKFHQRRSSWISNQKRMKSRTTRAKF